MKPTLVVGLEGFPFGLRTGCNPLLAENVLQALAIPSLGLSATTRSTPGFTGSLISAHAHPVFHALCPPPGSG